MKRLIALLVLAAVAIAPATASAKSRAKVYRGTFSFVGADGDYVRGKFGKAHLVDTRRDSLSVHVRRLAPRTKYVFRLQSGQTCKEGAAGGTDVSGWKYRRDGVLKTNRKGVANGSAKARHFRVSRDEDYGVVVSEQDTGTVVLCASLHRKHKGKPHKPHGKPHKPHGKKPHKPHGKKPHKPHGKPDADKRDDKPHGKPDHAGRPDDTPRGKSDEAPGHNKADGEKRATGRGHDKDKPRGKKSRRH
ncbi:MAG TPA: hypothetical protein VFZ00_19725 [Solirubrobacter sp.]|jgi:hypothetical protein|nr:hypothetical protein [Solirubrobacter sp.]